VTLWHVRRADIASVYQRVGRGLSRLADVSPPDFIDEHLHACRSATQKLCLSRARYHSALSSLFRFIVDQVQTLSTVVLCPLLLYAVQPYPS
jgi:hypothetical protein